MTSKLILEGCSTRAPLAVAQVHGRTLVIADPGGAPTPPLPGAATHVRIRSAAQVTQGDHQEPVDSIVALGQLYSNEALPQLLTTLVGLASPQTRLYFCEPTVATTTSTGASANETATGKPWDITHQLWLAGWSVIDSNRFTVTSGRSNQDFVRGIARKVLESPSRV